MSHQYLAQLSESTAAAITGNVGSIVAFGVGNADAEWLAQTMTKTLGQLQPQDFTGLPRYAAYVRLLIDGVPSAPFSVLTLPPPDVIDDRSRVVLDASRRQFSRPLADVRKQIERDLALT